MSYLPTAKLAQGGSFGQQSTKTYQSTAPFNTKLFVYSTSINSSLVTVGSLTVNPNATAANCPMNRVLQTNGKFLLPGVHPNISQPYIGVYDPISQLNGYIDPADPTFSVYDVNFPPSMYNLGISSPTATLAGQGTGVRTGNDSGQLIQATQNASVNAIDADIGEVVMSSQSGYVTVNSSAVTASSRIFLQQTFGVTSTINGIPNTPVVSSITNGSFVIGLTYQLPGFVATAGTRAGAIVGTSNGYQFFVAK
jgi:hypothetical protein